MKDLYLETKNGKEKINEEAAEKVSPGGRNTLTFYGAKNYRKRWAAINTIDQSGERFRRSDS